MNRDEMLLPFYSRVVEMHGNLKQGLTQVLHSTSENKL